MTDDSLYSDVPEVYEHEIKTMQMVLGSLQRKYAGVGDMANLDTQKRFIREAQGVFSENGFDVNVEFKVDVSSDPTDKNLYYVPTISLKGRVNHVKEFDHERQQHDIRSGILDGVKGVIDPNTGLLKEDPKKKLIL